MKILDAHLLQRFVTILLFALAAFVLIVIVVDLIGQLGNFIDKDVPGLIIVKYYVMFIPYIIVLALPIAMLLSSLFSIGQMAKYNELTAIKAAGGSLYRILAPLLILSILISGFALFFGETIVPKSNQEKTSIKHEYLESAGKRISSRITNIFMRDELDRLIFIGHFDSKKKKAYKVSIQKRDDTKFVERYDAQEMLWQDSTSTWVLINGYQRIFSENGEEAIPFETREDRFLGFTPNQLAESQTAPEDMSYSELKNFSNEVIRNGGNPTSWLVDLNLKISIPFANFVMVLFGTALASNKKRSGAVVGLLLSFVICFLYFGFVKLFQTIGYGGGLSPFVSAWLANGMFLVLGSTLLIMTRK